MMSLQGIQIKQVEFVRAFSKETGNEAIGEFTAKQVTQFELKKKKYVVYKLPYMRYGVIDDISFEEIKI